MREYQLILNQEVIFNKAFKSFSYEYYTDIF